MAENGNGQKMVKLTVNGHGVEVPAGTNILEAAHTVGHSVPHYCYHPGLSVPANCRICQVEIEGQPRLAFACRTPVAEGMVVHTDSEKAKAHQQLVQEFLLCNHPLDCPICDKSGECTLQDYYMDHGQYRPVMVENKYRKHKAEPIGPTIVLDTERCILCSRCVRFCDEVTGTSELGLFNRNNHMEIGVVPGTELDNPYSGNLVDICPVGALGDRDFRFKCRVWYLQTTRSICPGCAKGCNIVVDHQTQRKHKAGGARVMRLRPRPNPEVNGHWMCDEGRYGHRWHDEDRIRFASVRLEGRAQAEVLLQRAWDAALARFHRAETTAWAVVLSARMSNEELFIAKRLFIQDLGVTEVFVGPTPPGSEDNLLRRADKNPNTAGARALEIPLDDGTRLRRLGQGTVKNVWAIGHDVIGNLPGQARPALDTLIFQGTNRCATSEAADIVLPAATCFEKDGTFTNEDNRVQRFERALSPLGEAESDLVLLQRLGETLRVSVPPGSAADVFEALAASEPPFAGLTHESLGDLGAVLHAPAEVGA
jgi:NADH-quinone oxidoreductase subunit G